MIKHANIRLATLKILEKIPRGFYSFKEILDKHFLENYKWFMKLCKKNRKNKKEGTTMKASIYEWKEKINYANL